MTRTGWAAKRQKMTPWTLVEIISSDTPMSFSVLSARVREQRELLTISYMVKRKDTSLYQEPSFTQKPSKSDGWRQGCEVDEDDCSEDLRVQSVRVVAEEVTVTALHVLHHPTKGIAGTGQRVFSRHLWRFLNWTSNQIKMTLILITLNLPFLYVFF